MLVEVAAHEFEFVLQMLLVLLDFCQLPLAKLQFSPGVLVCSH